MAFNPLGALTRFFGKGVGWGFGIDSPPPAPEPTTYYVQGGSATPLYPFDSPTTGSPSISQLITDVMAGDGFIDGDVIEIVAGDEFIETSPILIPANDITIQSYGTNGADEQTVKPVIRCTAPVLFDATTPGVTNTVIKNLTLIPDGSCARVVQLYSGEMRGNIVDGSSAVSDESMVYAEYDFKARNNELTNCPDIVFMINDQGGEGSYSSIIYNTMVGFNGPAIRIEKGTTFAYSNSIDGNGVVGTKGLSVNV